MLHKYTLNNAHYFCETADITRPFPSAALPTQPSWEFVWNRWMTASLHAVGLSEGAPHLLQVAPASQPGLHQARAAPAVRDAITCGR